MIEILQNIILNIPVIMICVGIFYIFRGIINFNINRERKNIFNKQLKI